MTPVATLAGQPLEPPAEWPISYGTAPATAAFRMSLEAARLVVGQAAGAPVELVLGPTEVQAVYALRIVPTEHPDRALVEVADQRWIWARRQAASAYNVRRNTGDRFFAGGILETADLLPTEQYAEYSLDGGRPWTARGILESLLTEVNAAYEFEATTDGLEVEDLTLDGLTIAEGIAELLRRFLPGLALFVRRDGVVVIRDTLDGGEAAALSGRSPQWGGPEFPARIDNAVVRPSAVRVLFDRLIELPLKFTDTGAIGGADRTVNVSDAEAFLALTCVAPLPDPTLIMRGRTVASGSIVPMLTQGGLFASWNADTVNPWGATPGSLTIPYVLAHFASSFRHVLPAIVHATGAPSPILGARIRTTIQHYRLTMRPTMALLGKISSMQLSRVAIVNRGTGSRAVSPVYADYTVVPSFYGAVLETNGGTRRGGWHEQRDEWPRTVKAPFRLRWVDQGSFVFRFDPAPDLYGEADRILPGTPSATADGEDGVPAADVEHFNRSGEQSLGFFDKVTLAASWTARTVVSVAQASPNNASRLHVEEVSADDPDLGLLLGEAGGPENGQALGPPIEIRILSGEGIEAQYQWDGFDDSATQLAEIFTQEADPPDDALMNREALRDVALAVAASVYEPLLDRPRSTSAPFAMDPDFEPTGALRTVRHQLAPDGALRTVVSVPPVSRAPNWYRFLPPGTRLLLQRAATGLQGPL